MNPPPVSDFPVVTGYTLIISKADLSPSTQTHVYICIHTYIYIYIYVYIYVSSRGMGRQWPASGSGTLSVAVCAQDLLKDVAINFTTSTIGLRSNNREGTQFRLSTENWIKVVLSMAPNIRIRSSFPHSQSLPSGSLLSLFFRGQKE